MNESLLHHGVGMTTNDLFSASDDEEKIINIASLCVLLGGVAIGAVGLFVFFFSLFCKILDSEKVTVLNMSLILSCVLLAVSTSAPARELLGSFCQPEHCDVLSAMWLAYRPCVVLLNLLVALEFILTNQTRGITKTVPLCLSLALVLVVHLVCILFHDVLKAKVAIGAVALFLTVWMIRARCRSRLTPKPFNLVLCLSFVSFAGTYCPSFVMECMMLNGINLSHSLYNALLCSTNLSLITSVILCWVTCRMTFDEVRLAIEISSHHLEARF